MALSESAFCLRCGSLYLASRGPRCACPAPVAGTGLPGLPGRVAALEDTVEALMRVITAAGQAPGCEALAPAPLRWPGSCPALHPESMTAELPDDDEFWLTGVCEDLWPHDEYARIVREYLEAGQ